ncbi:MAG TPA: ABC transporter ATP-binding protein [Phycisphaerae bacterium]|nr:ABC transporter ATP-binding protein [Phycisphaerae bacterium]
MKAFYQALRYAWPYRSRILLAWLAGFVGSILWAGSIGSVLPLFNLFFQRPPEGFQVLEEGPAAPGRSAAKRTVVVSPSWTVVQGPEVTAVRSEGRTVYVPADVRIRRQEPGLRGLAQNAEQKDKFYAPLMRWLAERFPPDPFQSLAWIMGIIVVMMVLRGLMDFLYEYLVGHTVNRAVLALRLKAYDRVLRSPLSLFVRIGPSDIMSRFQQDMLYLMDGMSTVLGNAVVMPPRAAICLVMAIVIGVGIDPWLPVIVLVAAPIVGLLVRRFATLMRRATRKGLESYADLLGNLEEGLFGIRVIKGYRLEGHQRRRFFAATRGFFKNSLRAIRIQAATGPLVETIFTVAVALAVVVGARIILNRGFDQESVGELSAFFLLLAGALDPVRKLSNVSNRVQQASAAADRIFALMETEPEPRYGSHGTVLAPHHESIEFRRVSFAYDGNKPVLQDVSLSVRHGEVLAIIGRTGCGKTTLVSLVPRFFEPTDGAVLIDGIDIRQVTLRSLRDQIAIVPQETMLFADTVAANIALGAPRAGRWLPGLDAVHAAARAAHAHAFIEQLPQGYDTILGEHGTTLSGGERQRLALARAIIRDPAILVLDEATSSLDEETQQLVQETLQAFVRGRTTVLIAHRLSTLAIADRIAVMDAGRIVDVGTHAELLERCSLYRRFRDVGLE